MENSEPNTDMAYQDPPVCLTSSFTSSGPHQTPKVTFSDLHHTYFSPSDLRLASTSASHDPRLIPDFASSDLCLTSNFAFRVPRLTSNSSLSDPCLASTSAFHDPCLVSSFSSSEPCLTSASTSHDPYLLSSIVPCDPLSDPGLTSNLTSPDAHITSNLTSHDPHLSSKLAFREPRLNLGASPVDPCSSSSHMALNNTGPILQSTSFIPQYPLIGVDGNLKIPVFSHRFKKLMAKLNIIASSNMEALPSSLYKAELPSSWKKDKVIVPSRYKSTSMPQRAQSSPRLMWTTPGEFSEAENEEASHEAEIFKVHLPLTHPVVNDGMVKLAAVGGNVCQVTPKLLEDNKLPKLRGSKRTSKDISCEAGLAERIPTKRNIPSVEGSNQAENCLPDSTVDITTEDDVIKSQTFSQEETPIITPEYCFTEEEIQALTSQYLSLEEISVVTSEF